MPATSRSTKAQRQAAAESGTLRARTPWGEWWDLFTANEASASDRALKEGQVVDKHVRPRWEEVPLSGVKRGDVQGWIDELCRKGYAANYVRNVYAPLQRSLNAAIERGVLEASPLVNIKLPRRPRKAKKYVEPGEPASLRDKLHPVFVDACDYIIEVGCRPSEMSGLHLRHVDLEHGWVEIVHAYVQRLGKVRPSPKDDDVRRVPLSSRAIEIIQRQLDGRDLSGGCGVEHTDGAVCSSPLIFRNTRHGVLSPELLSRRMREAARELGLPVKSDYALRRGFATRAIEGGADVFAVQRIMEHADLDELAGYVQETPQARARMLAALGEHTPAVRCPTWDGSWDGPR